MATIIIMSSGYKFPFYLIGLCYLAMGIFGFYVYKKKEKGTQFLIMIFTLLGINAVLLGWVTVLKICYKKDINSPNFFAQKSRMYVEYVRQILTGAPSDTWTKSKKKR